MVPFVDLNKRSFWSSFFSPKFPKGVICVLLFNFFNLFSSVFFYLQSLNVFSSVVKVFLSVKSPAPATDKDSKLVMCLNNIQPSRIHRFWHLFDEEMFHHEFCNHSCWIFNFMGAHNKNSWIDWNWIKRKIESFVEPHQLCDKWEIWVNHFSLRLQKSVCLFVVQPLFKN